MKSAYYEAGVIGGGPAGSAAALHLASAGVETVLFEKKAFPREVLCGEFLSREVITNIYAMGIEKEFSLLEQNSITDFSLINASGREYSSALGFTASAMKRSVLDTFLLNKAESAGAAVYQPFTVSGIDEERGQFRVSGKFNNELKSFRVKYLIGAWGKSNVLDTKLGRGFAGYKSGLNGLKFHVDKSHVPGAEDHRIYIYSGGGIYCGINSVSEQTASLCFLERSRGGVPVKEKLGRLREANAGLRKLLSDNLINKMAEGPVYAAGNIYFGKKEPVFNNIINIGDSAGMIAPFTGDGIGMALETARLAAELVIKAKLEGQTPGALGSDYTRCYNQKFAARKRTALFVQRLMLNGAGEKASALIKLFPSIIPLIIRNTRGV